MQPQQICIGILGRITPFKGQWHFVEAARLVREQCHDVRFFLIGSPATDKVDQEYYGQLLRRVEQSDMKDAVFFIEHQRDVEKYLSIMDVVVVASQGPEALPQTLIEGMSMGKAVIAPASGGIVEILEDGKTGLFAEVAEPHKLAVAMMKLIDDSNLRQFLGRTAQERILRSHSREKFAEEIQSILKSCLTRECMARVPVSPEAA